MIAITVESKKALRECVGQCIAGLIVETSRHGAEYKPNVQGLPFVGPGAYERKFYGKITVQDGILISVK